MKLNREKVYELIDGEREYQKTQTIKNNWNEPKRVGEYLSVLRILLSKAENEWYSESDLDPKNTLSFIRKISAIGVACMEEHGAPKR